MSQLELMSPAPLMVVNSITSNESQPMGQSNDQSIVQAHMQDSAIQPQALDVARQKRGEYLSEDNSGVQQPSSKRSPQANTYQDYLVRDT